MPDLPGGSSAEPLRYQTICVTTGARRSGMTTISRPFASFACVIAGPTGLPSARAEGFRKTLSLAAAVSPKDIPAIAFKGGPSLSRKRAGVPVAHRRPSRGKFCPNIGWNLKKRQSFIRPRWLSNFNPPRQGSGVNCRPRFWGAATGYRLQGRRRPADLSAHQ
jgi:hypothetical protein